VKGLSPSLEKVKKGRLIAAPCRVSSCQLGVAVALKELALEIAFAALNSFKRQVIRCLLRLADILSGVFGVAASIFNADISTARHDALRCRCTDAAERVADNIAQPRVPSQTAIGEFRWKDARMVRRKAWRNRPEVRKCFPMLFIEFFDI